MAIINYIPNVKTATGFDTLNTVSQFTNHVATGVFTNGDTYEINVPAPNDILTGQFVLIFVPDSDSIVGMKISINNGTAIHIDGVVAGSLQNGVATSLLVNTVVGKAYMQVLGVKTPNKNLLHNWDFRNPVNQRGQSSYSAGYSIDRWGLNGGTLILGSGGIKISTAYVLYNISEKSYDTTKLYTFSYLDGDDNVHSAVIDTFGVYIWVDSKLNVQIIGASIYLESKDSDNIIKAVKLELGSVSTLANDPPADYGEQLALCQRYFLKATQDLRFPRVQINVNYIDFFVPTPVSLRTTPTISGTFEVRTIAGVAQTGFTFAIVVHGELGLLIRATKTSHGLTDAYINVTGGSVQFSADL